MWKHFKFWHWVIFWRDTRKLTGYRMIVRYEVLESNGKRITSFIKESDADRFIGNKDYTKVTLRGYHATK